MIVLFVIIFLLEVIVAPVVAPTGIWLITPCAFLYFGSRSDWRGGLIAFAAALAASWFVPMNWVIIGVSILLAIMLQMVFRLWVDATNRTLSTLVTATAIMLVSVVSTLVVGRALSFVHLWFGLFAAGVLWILYGRGRQGAFR